MMKLRPVKLRFRRRLRRGQKQVESLGEQAGAELEQHLFRRLGNLGKVWRFISVWLALLLIIITGLIVQLAQLGNQYQTLQPVAGGKFTEGILGTFTNANPLYATSPVDSAVSQLIFASLFTYNNDNQLVGDLASSYDVNGTGTVYTVHLKPHLTWQDGRPLTADDVVFTYQAIQNPDAQSPLAASWQGITVSKKDALTVTFTLPNPLSSFPYTLTNGIVPARYFAHLKPTEWRSANFNTEQPVGAGPFAWSALQVTNSDPSTEQVLIALKPFAHYHGGAPKLDGFVVHAFASQRQLVAAFEDNEITAAAGLNMVPAALQQNKTIQPYSILLTAATMAFFNTQTSPLNDTQVRQALVRATDVHGITAQLGYATRAVREPLLPGQLAYNSKYTQAGYDPAAAKALLDKAGWKLGKINNLIQSSIREKNGQPLSINLVASQDPEYTQVAHKLAKQWHDVGVQVHVTTAGADDLQNILSAHNYDVVLYGISIGVDPDVFVYWDSSQDDPRSTRLNLSQYDSKTADLALEAGRTRLDPKLRAVKYEPFLKAWQHDAPAVGLYQPRFLYLSHVTIYGLTSHSINAATDRFDNVANWMIRTAKVTNPAST